MYPRCVSSFFTAHPFGTREGTLYLIMALHVPGGLFVVFIDIKLFWCVSLSFSEVFYIMYFIYFKLSVYTED